MSENAFDKEMLRANFTKIQILSSISDNVCSIGMQIGLIDLSDNVDLNCGALPFGSFEQIIDENAPLQFLELYRKIAEFRFAYAATAVLNFKAEMAEFMEGMCFDFGKNLVSENGIEVSDVQTAFQLIQSAVLDGTVNQKTFEICNFDEEKIEWKKILDTHEEFWLKSGGETRNYYKFQTAFINGLLFSSEIKFVNENNSTFRLF